MSLSTSRTVQWQQHVQWVRGGGDGGERSRASLDRSIGPASAWPCYPPQPQLELTTQRAPLVERKVEGVRRKQRPASAPVRSDTGSSDASAAIAARPSSACECLPFLVFHVRRVVPASLRLTRWHAVCDV